MKWSVELVKALPAETRTSIVAQLESFEKTPAGILLRGALEDLRGECLEQMRVMAGRAEGQAQILGAQGAKGYDIAECLLKPGFGLIEAIREAENAG